MIRRIAAVACKLQGKVSPRASGLLMQEYSMRKRKIRTLERAAAFALLFGFVAASGCGDGKLPLYKVNGSVNVDGAPVEGVMVVFCPVGGSEEVQKKRPT